MRGRTFLNKYVIIDEAQNLTPKQMKTLITRAGPGTKIVCLGNLAQIDTPYLTEGSSGLTFAVDRFKGWPHSGHVTLARGERSRLADFASRSALGAAASRAAAPRPFGAGSTADSSVSPSRRPRAAPAARRDPRSSSGRPGRGLRRPPGSRAAAACPSASSAAALTKCTRAGRANAPSWPSTVFMMSPSSFSAAVGIGHRDRRPSRSTKAIATCPFSASATPTTATSATLGMARDALLDLARAEAVAGDVDDVVGAAEDEVVAVGVADAPVERVVDAPARDAVPVGPHEARIVAPDGLHEAGRRRPLDHDDALAVRLDDVLRRSTRRSA